MELTKVQRRVLADLAAGGCFFAALREPDDFVDDGVLFSELVGIVVHRPGSRVEERYRIRNKTAAPLYLATPALVTHFPGDSGFRCFEITDAGRAAIGARVLTGGNGGST
jgi:hypothetical protein